MLSLLKIILLSPGLVAVKLIRSLIVKPEPSRIYIKRQKTNPLAIIIAILFWGLILSYIAVSYIKNNSELTTKISINTTNINELQPIGYRENNVDVTLDDEIINPENSSQINLEENIANKPNNSENTTQIWLVILNSVPKKNRSEAEMRVEEHKKQGLEAQIFDTDALPSLKAGFWAVALGPYDSQQAAERIASLAKETVPNLMVRRGL